MKSSRFSEKQIVAIPKPVHFGRKKEARSRRPVKPESSSNGAYRRRERHSRGVDLLPVGAVNGSLEDWLTGPTVRGRAQAKTGGLIHVSELSGYAETKREETLAFSVLINNSPASAAKRAELIDENCGLLVKRKPSLSASGQMAGARTVFWLSRGAERLGATKAPQVSPAVRCGDVEYLERTRSPLVAAALCLDRKLLAAPFEMLCRMRAPSSIDRAFVE
jgi:hypothetical protein